MESLTSLGGAAKRRAAFRFHDESEDGGPEGPNGSDKILDEQEQEDIVRQLENASQQSSMLWRIASLILAALCFFVYLIVPLPSSSGDLVRLLFTRSFILFELCLGGLSSLTEFITTLPEPIGPPSPSSSSADSSALSAFRRPRRLSLSLKARLQHILQLPPELTASSAQAALSLRLSAPLLLALIPSGIRAMVAFLRWWRKGLVLEESIRWSAPFLVLFISFLARSYANELDREMDGLKGLKYANKGA